jgi:hypothetical protein
MPPLVPLRDLTRQALTKGKTQPMRTTHFLPMRTSARKSKNKNTKRNAGQKTTDGVATRNPEASHDGASPKESLQKHETLRRKARRANRRGFQSPIPSEPPRVIGLALFRRARPQQNDWNTNTQKVLIMNASLSALQRFTLRKVKQSCLRPLSMAAFNLIITERMTRSNLPASNFS